MPPPPLLPGLPGEGLRLGGQALSASARRWWEGAAREAALAAVDDLPPGLRSRPGPRLAAAGAAASAAAIVSSCRRCRPLVLGLMRSLPDLARAFPAQLSAACGDAAAAVPALLRLIAGGALRGGISVEAAVMPMPGTDPRAGYMGLARGPLALVGSDQMGSSASDGAGVGDGSPHGGGDGDGNAGAGGDQAAIRAAAPTEAAAADFGHVLSLEQMQSATGVEAEIAGLAGRLVCASALAWWGEYGVSAVLGAVRRGLFADPGDGEEEEEEDTGEG